LQASVSAYVAAALAEKAKLDELSELLQEMLSETGGPLTADERRVADDALGARRVADDALGARRVADSSAE
jgi:hypothetical protein